MLQQLLLLRPLNLVNPRRCPHFAADVFKLFDFSSDGFLVVGDVVDLAKYNFRGIESRKLKQLLQLFESCVQLAVDDPSGRMTPRDLSKALGGGQGLGGGVFGYLLDQRRESNRGGAEVGDHVTVDDLMRFAANMTAPM